MGRDLIGWVEHDEEYAPGKFLTWTFADLSFNRDHILFDLLASAGRIDTVASAIAEARVLDPAGVAAHLAKHPVPVVLEPKGLPDRLGHGPESALCEMGFVRPEGSSCSRLIGTPRDPDDYRADERPTYTWPPEDPACSGFSWLSQAEVAAVAARHGAVPVAHQGRVWYQQSNPQIATVVDDAYPPSRFVFWFED
jgi:hypothetical protein